MSKKVLIIDDEPMILDIGVILDQLIALSLKSHKISLVARPILQMLKYLAMGAVFVYGSWMISTDAPVSFQTPSLLQALTLKVYLPGGRLV